MPSRFCFLFLYFLHCMSDRVQWCKYYTSNNHDSDRHYRSALHTHAHAHISVYFTATLNSLFTFPKFFLLPLHYYGYQSVWSVPVMLCNSCCLQSTLCLWSRLVLTFRYVIYMSICIIMSYSRHNVLLLLNILYHHY